YRWTRHIAPSVEKWRRQAPHDMPPSRFPPSPTFGDSSIECRGTSFGTFLPAAEAQAYVLIFMPVGLPEYSGLSKPFKLFQVLSAIARGATVWASGPVTQAWRQAQSLSVSSASRQRP